MRKNIFIPVFAVGLSFLSFLLLKEYEQEKGQRNALTDILADLSASLGGGSNQSPSSPVTSFAPIPAPKPQFEPPQFPRDRALTQEEVFSIGEHMARIGLAVDPFTLTAMAKIESSFKPWASRDESGGRVSIGLMQTLVGTALDMYKKGYNAYPKPTRETLLDPVTSMYYGAAYVDWLKNSYPNHNLEWYVRAYNGGPFWERNGSRVAGMTLNHWTKFKKVFSDNGWTLGSGITIITG